MNFVLGCLHQSIFGQFPRLQISWLPPKTQSSDECQSFPIGLSFVSRCPVVVRAASKSSASLSLPRGGRILFITGINGIWRIDVYHVGTVRPNNSVNNPKPIQAQEPPKTDMANMLAHLWRIRYVGRVEQDRTFEFICNRWIGYTSIIGPCYPCPLALWPKVPYSSCVIVDL